MRKEAALPQSGPRLHIHVAIGALVLIVLSILGNATASGLM